MLGSLMLILHGVLEIAHWAETKFLQQSSVPWLSDNVSRFVRRSKTLKKIPSTLASKDVSNIPE